MKDAHDNYKSESDEGYLVELECYAHDGNGVKAFRMTDKSYDSLSGRNYAESGPFFMQMCKTWNLHYYARPTETFSMDEAYKEAHKAGCRGVVIEGMS